MLGLRSANGTSTVILTRVGLNCSTVLGTLVTPVVTAGGTRTAAGPGSIEAPAILRWAYGGQPSAAPSSAAIGSARCALHSTTSGVEAGRLRGVA